MPLPPPPPGPNDPHDTGDQGFDFEQDERSRFDERSDFERQATNWGMLCHLSSLCAYVGVPFGHIAGPLIVWLIKRNEFPYVNEQGKESLNFQITMTLYYIIAALLVLVFIGFFLLFALAAFQIVAVIVASVRANEGRPIRYPLTIRFLK